MQLNISELDDEIYNMEDNSIYYNNQHIQSSFEQIPENTVPIKVIKKGVHFEEPLRPTHQAIPRVNAKIVRPQTPVVKPKISYEDILSKMGMFVSDGKLHLVDRNTLTPQKKQELLNSQANKNQYQQVNQPYETNIESKAQHNIPQNIPQNSYIYNKYFKDDLQPQNIIRQPKTLEEYKIMLIKDHIQRQRIKQIKSTKLIMPTSNIHFSGGHSANLNKLFSFSKR